MTKAHAASEYWTERHKDPKFLKERDKWREKLKKSGFEDLEMIDVNTREISRNMLKGMSPGDLWRGLYTPEAEDFFRFARQHYWEIPSTDPVERKIWKLFADGMPPEAIFRETEHDAVTRGKKTGRPSREYIKWVIQYETKRMWAKLTHDLDMEQDALDADETDE